MSIYQAVALPLTRGRAALNTVEKIVTHLQSNGFIEHALQRHQISGYTLC